MRRSRRAVCGAGPVEKLLFPVAVHFKGSGFASTDYGRSGRKPSRTATAAATRPRRTSRTRQRRQGLRGTKKPRRKPTPVAQPAYSPRRTGCLFAVQWRGAAMNIGMTLTLSSPRYDHGLAADRLRLAAPRRQRSDLPAGTAPSRAARAATREVGREWGGSHMNGSLTNVEARDLVADRLGDRLLVAGGARRRLGWVELVRANARVDSARRPSMCCFPLPKRHPSQLEHRAGGGDSRTCSRGSA